MSLGASRFKSRRIKRLCQCCHERPATYRQPKTGHVKADDKHDLCPQCYKAFRDSTAEKRPRRQEVVVTISCGPHHAELRFPPHKPWKEQNAETRALLHDVRTRTTE